MRVQKLFIIGLAMALLMLTGCRAQNNIVDTDSRNQSESDGGSYKDYSKGFPDKVTLEIPVYERAAEGWNTTDNFYTRWIQKEFGDVYNVNVKFVSINRSSEVTDYYQLLASRKAPDIIYHYDMPQARAYYSQHVMQNLDLQEIAHYAPTYWGKMGAIIEEYGEVEGENAFFFAARPEADIYATLIRKDWVEKVGMKMEDLTSLEIYNEMLLKWKQFGLGVGAESLKKSNYLFNYPFRDWPIHETEHALYSDIGIADLTTPATERYLRNLNYQYHNGLIDKEFILRDDDSKVKAEFIAGKTGTFSLHLTSNTDVIKATLQNNPEAKFAILDPQALTPEGYKPQTRAYWPFGLVMGINAESSDAERIAVWMYLEWMIQPENLLLLQNGVEGENYTIDSDGLPVSNPNFDGQSMMSPNNNKDYWALVTELPEYSNPATTRQGFVRSIGPVGYEYLGEELLRIYEKNVAFRTPDAFYTVVLHKVNEHKADLDALFQELYVRIATAAPDEFDMVYEAAKNSYLQAGYQDVLNEKEAAIRAGYIR